MDRIELETYRRHRAAALFEGAFGAVIWSTPDIARKALGADHLLITLITMAPAVAQTVAIFVAGRLASSHPRRTIRNAAIIGRAPVLVLLFWADDPWIFLAIVAIQALAFVAIISSWNGVLRSNYSSAVRGQLFGKASRYQNLSAAIAIVGSGIWAQVQDDAYAYFLPIAAVLGIIGCRIFSGVELREQARAAAPAVRLGSARTLLGVLVDDRRFLRYELGFFLYGVGFMALMTAKPFIAVDQLELDWGILLGARAIVPLLGVALSPLYGRWMDRIGAPRLGALAFGCLVLYGATLGVAKGPWSYCLAECVFGIAMAAVLILWNMGPLAFAPEGRAMDYMSVHVALVGVRGLIGHPIGGWMAHASDPRWVILFSALCWVAGSLVMASLGRRMRREDDPRDPPNRDSDGDRPPDDVLQ